MLSGSTHDAHDIDGECGYPIHITFEMYKAMYHREGIATRVVSAFSQECWSVWPWVYETESMEEDEQTPFEKKWKEIEEKHGLYGVLSQFDEISGVGQYAVLLIGYDDGRSLETIAPGIDENGDMIEGDFEERNILYFRVFDQGEAPIESYNTNQNSKRYGLPQIYRITVADPSMTQIGSSPNPPGQSIKVHWSRVIHLPSDGRAATSKVFGPPRQENVFNYLLNCRKILGGSGEMLWKGGFPLTVFEVPPEIAAEVELDKESIATEVEEAMEGLKRYMALQGVLAKQLMPNIADPDSHLNVQLLAISIALGIPQRILMGTEEARLASLQDSTSWNKKVHRRHGTRCTPDIMRPLVDRLIAIRVLPSVDKYYIEWPDLYSISESDKADITGKLVKALSEYVTSGASRVFPPLQFLTLIMDFTTEEAEEIIEAAIDAVDDKDILKIVGPTEMEEAELEATKVKSDTNRNFGKPKEKPATRQFRTNQESSIITVNPLVRCTSDGSPGFKYGDSGKCYVYKKGDKASIRRAKRKARLQGTAIEATKILNSMEKGDG